MSLIEGIGDEVTLVVGGFLLCIILMLAWLSTHTADIPLLREVGVIVVELRQRRSRSQNVVSEERSIRDDTSSPTEGERQIYDIDHQTSDTSDTQIRAGSASENITPVERIHASLSPPSPSESADIQDVSASQDLLPDHAEAMTSNADLTSLMNASPQGRRKSDAQVLSNVSEAETFVPKASVVVDDNIGFAFPNEEEIRQRRVQYFQANKPAQTVTGESTTYSDPEDNRSSSLSEVSTYDGDTTRQVKDTVQSSNPPSSDQNQRTEVAQGSVALNSKTSSHPVPAGAAADLGNRATSSVQEDISNIQTSSIQSENSDSSKIRVKLKYMNETQRLVYAKPLDTIGEFRRTHFQAELQDNKWVRFIYNGQDLRDDNRTLQACSIGDNCTMHCLITARTQPHTTRDAVPEEDEDSFMGTMMYPLFTVIILIVWYFRFTYRQYFSAMSTVCLIGISFLLALSYISSLRTADRVPSQQRVGPSTATAAGGGGVREEHQHTD